MSPLAPPSTTTGPAVLPQVRLVPPHAPRDAVRLRTLLRRAGLHCEPAPEPGRRAPSAGSGTVTVAVVASERDLHRLAGTGPLVLICDTVTRSVLRQALQAGVVVLRSADLTAEGLRDAVRRAEHPLPSIPYPMLSHLLAREGRPAGADHGHHGGGGWEGVRPSLTARQVRVLRLMAEGHGNASIAQLLDCSEHTVKNIVYEVMSRLQARNRAHAVARALRDGLI